MNQQNVGAKRATSSQGSKIAAKSHEAAEQWKDAVVGQVNQAREQALTAQERTSDRIRGVAGHLHQMGESMRERDPMIADLADRAGRGVEGVARYVQDATPQSFVRDTEQLARRQPALFYGAAFLLGLAAGRFVKSSAPAGNGYTRREDDEGSGEQASRLPGERDSGFFAQSERTAPVNPRFRENYDATFGRDGAATGNNGPGTNDRTPERPSASAPPRGEDVNRAEPPHKGPVS